MASVGVLLPPTVTSAIADTWWPIDLNDPSLKAPVLEHQADAEGIFWDVVLDDAAKEGLVLHNYLRIKIFTARGAAAHGKIDIPYRGQFRIDGVFARTVRPDGSAVELNPQDVFERTIVQVGKAKINVKSFVLPDVQPGAIIEYRWREVRPNTVAYYVQLPFQREIPMRRVSYHFRQNPWIPNAAMRMAYFNMSPIQLVPEANSFYRVTYTYVPAFREEPRMPPEDEVRSWALVYYVFRGTGVGDDYWQQLSKRAFDVFKRTSKSDAEVREVSKQVVANASSTDEKLQRLFDYCRSRIKNIRSVDSGMSESELQNRKANKTASDTLKEGRGSGFEINMLFAALARAAGFDARIAMVPDRSQSFFHRSLPVAYSLSVAIVAIKFGDTWRFFDPGALYSPYGMLRWQHEGESALITDSSKLIFAQTPQTSPETSKRLLRAKFQLIEDGTLEGEINTEYSGHLAVEMTEANADLSPEQREKNLRDSVTARIRTAQVSAVRIDEVTGPRRTFSYSYRVHVPNYVERGGKQIFLKPAFFQNGLRSIFSASSRTNDIYFPFAWSERDEVVIELPRDYQVSGFETMKPHTWGQNSSYASNIVADGRVLTYRRDFVFGGTGRLLFAVREYESLKNYFDALQQTDNFTIALKRTAADSDQ